MKRYIYPQNAIGEYVCVLCALSLTLHYTYTTYTQHVDFLPYVHYSYSIQTTTQCHIMVNPWNVRKKLIWTKKENGK